MWWLNVFPGMIEIMRMFLKAMAVTWSAVIVVACSGGGGEDDPGVSTSFDGTLTLQMGDAPVDNVKEVNITVSAIEFGGKDGSTSDVAVDTVEIDPPKTFNLLDYPNQSGEFFTLLDSEEVDAGEYSWVRLKLDEDNPPEVVDNDNDTFELSIPSGAQTGLKLHGSGTLSIDSGDTHQYAIDLDLHQSLKLTGAGVYKLKPSYRLIDLDNVFSVSGQINVTLPGSCNGAVYVYKGNVEPDDIENPDDGSTISGTNSDDSVEPFIVEVLESDFSYTIDHLPGGIYTFAFTCDVDADDPDEDNDDEVSFLGEATVTISGDTSNVSID